MEIKRLEQKLFNHNSHWNFLQKVPQMVNNQIVLVETSIPIIHNDISINRAKLKLKELDISLKLLIASDQCKSLVALKKSSLLTSNDCKLEYYIKNDIPMVSKLRAKYRFNNVLSNQILFRYNLVPYPFCPYCVPNGENITETRDHILLKCPAYLQPRNDLYNYMHLELKLDLDYYSNNDKIINILLADFRCIEEHPSDKKLLNKIKNKLLLYTGEYLLIITNYRKLK